LDAFDDFKKELETEIDLLLGLFKKYPRIGVSKMGCFNEIVMTLRETTQSLLFSQKKLMLGFNLEAEKITGIDLFFNKHVTQKQVGQVLEFLKGI